MKHVLKDALRLKFPAIHFLLKLYLFLSTWQPQSNIKYATNLYILILRLTLYCDKNYNL